MCLDKSQHAMSISVTFSSHSNCLYLRCILSMQAKVCRVAFIISRTGLIINALIYAIYASVMQASQHFAVRNHNYYVHMHYVITPTFLWIMFQQSAAINLFPQQARQLWREYIAEAGVWLLWWMSAEIWRCDRLATLHWNLSISWRLWYAFSSSSLAPTFHTKVRNNRLLVVK